MKLTISTLLLSSLAAAAVGGAPAGDANALFLRNALRAARRAVVRATKKVRSAVKRVATKVRNAAQHAVRRVTTTVRKAFRAAKRIVRKAGTTIRGLFDGRFLHRIRSLLRFRLGREIAKLRAGVAQARARARRMLTRAKKNQLVGWVKKNWGPLKASIVHQAKAWRSAIRTPAAKRLIRRIILRVLQRKNDRQLLSDAKALASMQEAAAGRTAKPASTRRAAAARAAALTPSPRDIRDCQGASGLDALKCALDNTHPTRAVMFGLAAGLILGLHGSIGVVWRGDKAAMMLCGGGLVGAIEEIEPQAYYSWIQSEPSAAGGFGIGVAATAALGIGIEGALGWSIEKGMSPAPDLSLGGAIGEGVGIAFDATYCLTLGGK